MKKCTIYVLSILAIAVAVAFSIVVYVRLKAADEPSSTATINNETTIEIEIVSSLNETKEGDTLHLTCKVNGDASAPTMWMKADGCFKNNVETRANVLNITDMQITNAGMYRCVAFTRTGFKFMDYYLNISSDTNSIESEELRTFDGGDDNHTVANVTKKSVKYGHDVDLDCGTDVDPSANCSWIIHSYEKSLRKIVANTKTLTVKDASVNDSGIYFCNAVSNRATLRLPTVLTVENVVPAFAGNSYLTLPSIMKNSPERSVIEIHFKPKSGSGLILYTALRDHPDRALRDDFISFGLNRSFPEFIFDIGGGARTVRGDAPLQMNKWHKVLLYRNKRTGSMQINGGSNFTDSTQGRYNPPNLKLPLFVGGHSNYTYISWETGNEFNTGFEGCIRRLRIDSKEIILGKEALREENVTNCDSCDTNPCLNDGFCQQTTSSVGYYCICRPGYSGENCQLAKDICYADSCGTGQCLENENGIECLCPFGKAGRRCEKRIDIDVPAFTKNSYLAYALPNLEKKFKLLLKLKPVGDADVENGIILYVAESARGNGDFLALSIVNGYVELRFKVGDRSVNVTSKHHLVPDEYVTVSLTMDSSQVVLSVADATTLMSNPSGYNSDLQLRTLLYVGGYDENSILLPQEMSVRNGFHGCISTIELSGEDVNILQWYSEAINVNDCFSSFGDICYTTSPCKNGGKCVTSRNTYRCDCRRDFGGTNCERRKNSCEKLNPCKNNGQCVSFSDSFKCNCGLGFSGDHCEFNTTLENDVSFGGDGYVELQSDAQEEIVSVSFATKNSSGLLYWRGQQILSNGSNNFISIAIENGFVRLAYEADGSGVKNISATDGRVDDGETHSVTVRRVKTQISIELDSKTIDSGEIPEMWTMRGNIFIGGLPNVSLITGNLFADHFNGCIQQLRINDSVINFGQMAVSARNAATCAK